MYLKYIVCTSRLHYGIQAYKELLTYIAHMDSSDDEILKDASSVIKSVYAFYLPSIFVMFERPRAVNINVLFKSYLHSTTFYFYFDIYTVNESFHLLLFLTSEILRLPITLITLISRSLCSDNVFYHEEYRSIFLVLIRHYDSHKQTKYVKYFL